MGSPVDSRRYSAVRVCTPCVSQTANPTEKKDNVSRMQYTSASQAYMRKPQAHVHKCSVAYTVYVT